MRDIEETPSNSGGQIKLFHVVVIALSLTLTLAAWQFSIRQVESRNGLRFEAARDQVLGLISDRMLKYEDALWAGVAAIESHGGDISYRDWRIFAENLRIDERYPGINGIGVIHLHSDETLDEYLKTRRTERPDFRIYPKHDQQLYMPITFIEPEDTNEAALGLDVAHETNRRQAALASRDTGTAQITGPIVLVQDAGQTSGFLFYAPFYRGGAQASVVRRREEILGLVYAPFVVHKLMEGLLAKELRGVRFSIRDGDTLIYDEHEADDPLVDPEPMFSEQVPLQLYGRTWMLDMRSDLAFRAENTNDKPTIILVAGLLIEALIVSLLLIMSRANARAMTYADRVTRALLAEREKLVFANADLIDKNAALERFAYVASHDLKTPIRGINGLTEMIEEDLEEYLASTGANPDVATNLTRIRDRVRRMEHLTNGIMELSRIEVVRNGGQAITLDEVTSELALDFGLEPEELSVSGGGEVVRHDPANFHSVIENLIGNAIKYHDGKSALRINVSAVQAGDRLRVSVSDNGPGIDPKHHGRIFEVFQTLPTEKSLESTGIGLAIVRRAVESHDGTVTLRSELGEGATFSFDWPLERGGERDDPIDEAA